MPQSFTQVTGSLCVAQSAFYLTNIGLFVDEGQALLIDPGLLPAEIEAVRDHVAEQGASPQDILLTHCHWDHILGPERFPGVKTVAQAAFSDVASGRRGARIRRQVEKWEAHQDIGRTEPFSMPSPDETFTDHTTLNVGSLALQLMHAPGHAADQLVAYELGSGVLWAADMLSDLEIPYVGHSLVAYERTLVMLSVLDVRVLVPGHGHSTTKPEEIRSRLTGDRTYLGELRARVERAVREGRTVEETVERCADMQFAHPEENEGPHRMNTESGYLELGGEADPSKIGWDRLTTEIE
jgi:hydroxyacylglutathione hydrolase